MNIKNHQLWLNQYEAICRVSEAGQSKTIYQLHALLNGLVDCVRLCLSLKAKHKLLRRLNLPVTVLSRLPHLLQYLYSQQFREEPNNLHLKKRNCISIRKGQQTG